MKQLLRFANLIALAAGGIGMLLMLWLYAGGTDDRGLFPAKHPGWILLLIFTAVMVAVFFLLTRQVGSSNNYRSNFPASWLGALGCLAGGVGLLIASVDAFQINSRVTTVENPMLGIIVGVLGAVGGALLFWAAWCRRQGHKSMVPPHILPSFFFALRLFLLGQTLGAEPEMQRYLFSFLANLSLLPACYWLWSFDVNMGRRPHCLFWCLTAAYCNMVAAIGSNLWIMHLCLAAWLLTNLPRLKYLPKKQRPAPVETTEAPAVTEVQDVEATLEQIISEYGSNADT